MKFILFFFLVKYLLSVCGGVAGKEILGGCFFFERKRERECVSTKGRVLPASQSVYVVWDLLNSCVRDSAKLCFSIE